MTGILGWGVDLTYTGAFCWYGELLHQRDGEAKACYRVPIGAARASYGVAWFFKATLVGDFRVHKG